MFQELLTKYTVKNFLVPRTTNDIYPRSVEYFLNYIISNSQFLNQSRNVKYISWFVVLLTPCHNFSSTMKQLTGFLIYITWSLKQLARYVINISRFLEQLTRYVIYISWFLDQLMTCHKHLFDPEAGKEICHIYFFDLRGTHDMSQTFPQP